MYGHGSDGERLILLQPRSLLKDLRDHQNGEAADNRDRVHVRRSGKTQAADREMQARVVAPQIDDGGSSDFAEDDRPSHPTDSARVLRGEGQPLAQGSKNIAELRHHPQQISKHERYYRHTARKESALSGGKSKI